MAGMNSEAYYRDTISFSLTKRIARLYLTRISFMSNPFISLLDSVSAVELVSWVLLIICTMAIVSLSPNLIGMHSIDFMSKCSGLSIDGLNRLSLKKTR